MYGGRDTRQTGPRLEGLDGSETVPFEKRDVRRSVHGLTNCTLPGTSAVVLEVNRWTGSYSDHSLDVLQGGLGRVSRRASGSQ